VLLSSSREKGRKKRETTCCVSVKKEKNPAEQGSGHMCECEKRKKPSRTGLRSHVVSVLREKWKACSP
jgi:hypothetical protein